MVSCCVCERFHHYEMFFLYKSAYMIFPTLNTNTFPFFSLESTYMEMQVDDVGGYSLTVLDQKCV